MKRLMLLTAAVMPVLLLGCASDVRILPGIHKVRQMSGLEASDEEQIAAVLDDVQRGMENRQIYRVLAHVSRNYYDEMGRDYAALESYLTEIFKRYQQIKITRVPPRIAVYGDTARVLDTFGTVANPQDPTQQPPIQLQGQMTVNFERVNGQWQIVEWGQML